MSNYNSLKATIDAYIKQNGNQEITGQILNSVLNQMVTTLGAGYQFAGVAVSDTDPGTPDAKVFYIANGKGTYEKFGGINVTEDDVVVLYWDTAWHKVATGIASQAKLSELEQLMQEGYTFMGVATPETNPGKPDQKVFYIANDMGVYLNFGGIENYEPNVVLLVYDSGWKKLSTNISTIYEHAIANRVTSGGTLSFPQSVNSFIDRWGRIRFYEKARVSKDLIKIGSNVELKYEGLLRLDAAIVEYDVNLNIIKFWNVKNSPEFAIDGKITSLTFKTSEKTTYIDFCTLSSMTISFVGDGSLDYYIVNRNDFLRETPSLCKFTNSKLGSFAYEGLNTDGYSHIILYGQSLSTGDNSYVPVTGVLTPIQEGCYMVGQDPTDIEGPLNQLKAAVPNNSSYQHSNGGESPICNAVYAFKACLNHTPYKGVKLIGSACGYGGKTIEQLSDVDGVYYNRFKSVVNTAKSDAGNEKINCPAIIWMQGELNQSLNSATTVLDYKEKLVSLKNNMQAYVMQIYGQKNKPLFYVFQPSYLFTPKYPIVAQALLELSLENEDIIMMGPHYFCPVSDVGHLTSNGYRWYGEYIAKALYQTLIYGQRLTPILPKEIKIEGVKQRVVIDFLLPNPPFKLNEILTPSVQDYGFAFYKNNVKQEISNIIIRENQVIIYVPIDNVATYEIEYAGQATNGMGNISDSDEYVGFGIFIDPWNIYVDGASNDPNYNKTSLIDADLMYKYRGKTLVGQKYPCFNWIPTFRKALYL